jgi:hypothetical protein
VLVGADGVRQAAQVGIALHRCGDEQEVLAELAIQRA